VIRVYQSDSDKRVRRRGKMNPSNIEVGCSGCEFYEEGICKNFDGEYFLWHMNGSDKCPDFLCAGEYSFREILEHLERN